jgi:hypothetical protein
VHTLRTVQTIQSNAAHIHTSPKTVKLVEILTTYFSTSNVRTTSKAIVFVALRTTIADILLELSVVPGTTYYTIHSLFTYVYVAHANQIINIYRNSS